MSKKILISTWCTDDYADFLGVQKLVKSVKYFHPNIEHVIFNTKMTKKAYEEYPWLSPVWMMPPTCIPFAEDYDMVIHLDADSIVTGPLNELFESESDVIGVRNNNSFNKSGSHNGITISHLEPFGDGSPLPVQDFINAGLVGVNRKEFWYDWLNLNKESERIKREVNPCAHGIGDENDTLNQLFHWKKYNSQIIDPIGSNISYGLCNMWGNDPNNHWKSWDQIYVKDDRLYIDDPVTGDPMWIKVMHRAGGGLGNELNKRYGGFHNWLESVVSNETLEYIKKITL